jgi:tripartite-type tricarboxylate transporter receptor subunit TctC
VVKERLAALGVEPMPLTTADFDVQVKQEIARDATFAKAAGLKPN